MSEETYQRNVARGVTGEDSANCLLASYDRISVRRGLSPQVYERYEAFRYKFEDVCGDDASHIPAAITREWAELKRAFWLQLGVPTPRNIIQVRVNTPQELGRALQRLLNGGFRPAVYLDTGGLHAVGVMLGRKGYLRARSTWTPFEDEDHVSLAELFEWLDRARRLRTRPRSSKKTVVEHNIIALPPEGRR